MQHRIFLGVNVFHPHLRSCGAHLGESSMKQHVGCYSEGRVSLGESELIY